MPTAKRQRQKEGHRARLEARRKAEKRRRLIRRSTIIAIVAVIVGGSSFLILGNNNPSSSSTVTTTTFSTTTTTLAPHTVSAKEVAAIKSANAASLAIITANSHLTAAEAKNDQAAANAKAVRAGCPNSQYTLANSLHFSAAPPMSISTTGKYKAIITTDLGEVVVVLDAKSAPVTVNNFIYLAQHAYYNCNTIFRVIPKEMDQMGSPTQSNSGTPGYSIPDEDFSAASLPQYQYPPGTLAMANTGSPHTGGAQFFIVTNVDGEMLADTYTPFGRVISGLSIMDKINGQGTPGGGPTVFHRMLSVRIVGPTA